MMIEDFLTWIADQIAAGVDLYEQGWGLRTAADAEVWRARENEWTAATLDGIAARNPKDFGRINTLQWIETRPMPSGHPWQEIRFNPLNCHATRIKRLLKVEQEWRTALSSPRNVSGARNDHTSLPNELGPEGG